MYEILFQYLMVQLKVWIILLFVHLKEISIPHGTIKRMIDYEKGILSYRISIPHGTIKRGMPLL